jgi:flavin reductase (DIM6/NTAB) family NADH-FMN oxidoreductase RutF
MTGTAVDRPIDDTANQARTDEQQLRYAYSLFPSGVTALAALIDDQPVGMAASSFTSVSLNPSLVSVCVARTSTTWPVLAGAERLGVSVLSGDHVDLCRALATKDGDRFADASWESRQGAVFMHGSALWLECTIAATVPAGDHLIVLLEVAQAHPFPDVDPLVFHLSRLQRLGTTR